MISVEHLSAFGEALKELRWKARLKQVDICRAAGMTAPQVSRYENGREMPTVESLVKYLSAVGADFGDLQGVLEALAAGREPAAAPPPSGLQEVRDAGDRRLESSAGLRQMLGGLINLNLDGMERIEHRMVSLEERLDQMDQANRARKSGA